MADWMYPKEGVDRVPERPSKLAELAGGPKFPWMPARTEEEVEEEEEAPVMVPEEPEPAPPKICLLYTSPSPRDQRGSRMPSSA